MARQDEARFELLARYLDGEVSPAEAEEAERIFGEDPQLAAELTAVKGLGALLKEDVSRAAARVDFSGMADLVLKEAEARAKPSLWERIEAFFKERFGGAAELWLPGAVVAAAAIAALLLARPHAPEQVSTAEPRNELVITRVDSDKNWVSQTIDDEGTTVLWIDDSEPEE